MYLSTAYTFKFTFKNINFNFVDFIHVSLNKKYASYIYVFRALIVPFLSIQSTKVSRSLRQISCQSIHYFLISARFCATLEIVQCIKFCLWNEISVAKMFRLTKKSFGYHTLLEVVKLLKTKNIPDDYQPLPMDNTPSKSKIKVMLIVFFDYRGVLHSEFLPSGQTVNKDYYLSVMFRLREAIHKKRSEL